MWTKSRKRESPRDFHSREEPTKKGRIEDIETGEKDPETPIEKRESTKAIGSTTISSLGEKGENDRRHCWG